MESHSQHITNCRGSLNSLREPKSTSAKRGISGWLLAKLAAESAARHCTNPFSSITEMCETLHLQQSKFKFGWRLTKSLMGEINGLPASHGMLIATDGVMCIIYRTDSSIYTGHYQYFTPVPLSDEEIAQINALDPLSPPKTETKSTPTDLTNKPPRVRRKVSSREICAVLME